LFKVSPGVGRCNFDVVELECDPDGMYAIFADIEAQTAGLLLTP